MKLNLQFLRRFYGLFLTLYPPKYREDYGRELQSVFDLSLDEAVTKGGFEVEKLVLRELVSLPKAILYEHLRERRRSIVTGKFASRFNFAPGSWIESFVALAPFLFGMVMVLLGYIGRYLIVPLWMQIAFVIFFWSLVLGLFLLGSAKGLPRWFLSYLGLPLPIVSLLLFNSLMEKWGGVWWYRLPWLLSAFIQEGLFWMGLVLTMALLLVATILVPKFRPFYRRLREDWTLLSFLLYGTVPLALFITFNEYKNVEPFFFLSLLMLAIGGWFYLRNEAPWKRFWSLFIGLALSMLTAAVGKAVLYEESWPQAFYLGWKNEMVYTLVTWAWLALIMLIPPALNLLPRSKNSLQTT